MLASTRAYQLVWRFSAPGTNSARRGQRNMAVSKLSPNLGQSCFSVALGSLPPGEPCAELTLGQHALGVRAIKAAEMMDHRVDHTAEGDMTVGRRPELDPGRRSASARTRSGSVSLSVRPYRRLQDGGELHGVPGPEQISQIAIDIEPTDGSMYSDTVAHAHREGRLLEHLWPMPPFVALTILDGQEVDTIEFDFCRRSFHYSSEDIRRLRDAWDCIRTANRQRDLSLMGRACTVSARINEKFLPKPLFAEIHDLVERGLGEGLIVAHSGRTPLTPNAVQPHMNDLRKG